jgi:hypothetical protein
MNAWAELAVRELKVELKRLDLDAEAKRTTLDRAQAEYEAVMAERATVRGMLDWAVKKVPVQELELPEPLLEMRRVNVSAPVSPPPGAIERPAQTDLAIHALRQLGGRASTAQVRELLEGAGYQYDQTQVRSALKYLANKKNPQVEAAGVSMWRLRDEAEEVAYESESVPAVNGTRGSP